jgi:hypothetical protein
MDRSSDIVGGSLGEMEGDIVRGTEGGIERDIQSGKEWLPGVIDTGEFYF